MADATEYLRRLAQGIVDEALERVPLRAALLAGSAGRGDADLYSDIDLLLYVDQVPPWEVMAQIREAVGGINGVPRAGSTEHFRSEEFDLHGVSTEVTFVAVTWHDRRLDELLGRIEEFDSPSQKILSGVLEGRALHGEELIERWRARASSYPEPLRRALVERHWKFFPLWYYHDAIALRDAELWRLDVLLEAAFDLLGILAALNRVYLTRFQLKRMRGLIAKMELAPPQLAERVESLFRLEPELAATELATLINETRALVASEMPDLDLPLPFTLEARIQPWSGETTPPGTSVEKPRL